MKVKAALFTRTFFHCGVPLYVAGQTYPLNEDTERRIKLGDAEEVDVESDGVAATPLTPAPRPQQAQAAARAPRATRTPKEPAQPPAEAGTGQLQAEQDSRPDDAQPGEQISGATTDGQTLAPAGGAEQVADGGAGAQTSAQPE